MKQFEFLDTVDQFYRLRKKYNIKQKDLDCPYLSKRIYSFIETKQRKLTEKSLKKIIMRFNEIFEEREIDLSLSVENIVISPEEQLKSYIEFAIEEIKKGKIHYQIEIENLLKTNKSFLSRGIFYKFLGDKAFQEKNYLDAQRYYNKILDNLIANKYWDLLLEVTLNLSRIYYYYGNKEKLQELMHIYDDYLTGEKTYELQILLYNISLGYYLDNNYNKTLEVIRKIDITCDKKLEFRVLLLKGVCLENNGILVQAEKIYNSLLEKEDELKNIKILKTNLMENWRKQNEYGKIRSNLFEYEKLINKFSPDENHIAYYLLGRIFMYFGEKITGKMYYLKSISIDFKIGNENFESRKYFSALKEYINLCDTKQELNDAKQFFLKNNEIISNDTIRFEFIKRYLSLGLIDEISDVLI